MSEKQEKTEAEEGTEGTKNTPIAKDRIDFNNTTEQAHLLTNDIFNSPLSPRDFFTSSFDSDGDTFFSNANDENYNYQYQNQGQEQEQFSDFAPPPRPPPPSNTTMQTFFPPRFSQDTQEQTEEDRSSDQIEGRNYVTSDSRLTAIKSKIQGSNNLQTPLIRTTAKEKRKPTGLNEVIKDSVRKGFSKFIEDTAQTKNTDSRSVFLGLNPGTIFLPHYKYQYQPDSRALKSQSTGFTIPPGLSNELQALKRGFRDTAGVNTQVQGLVARRNENEQVNSEIKYYLGYKLPKVQTCKALDPPGGVMEDVETFKRLGRKSNLEKDQTYKEQLEILTDLRDEICRFFPDDLRRLPEGAATCYGTTFPTGEDMLNLAKLEGVGVYSTREEELVKIGCVYGYNCALAYQDVLKKFHRAYNKATRIIEDLLKSRRFDSDSEDSGKPARTRKPSKNPPILLDSDEDLGEPESPSRFTTGLRGKKIQKKQKKPVEPTDDASEGSDDSFTVVIKRANRPTEVKQRKKQRQTSLRSFVNSEKTEKKERTHKHNKREPEEKEDL